MTKLTPLALALTLTLAGCGKHEPAPGEAPADACIVRNRDRVVSASGYFAPTHFVLGCERSCLMYVAPAPHEQGGLMVRFAVGEGPRTLRAIPDKPGAPPGAPQPLSERDFELRDDAGKPIRVGDVIRVTGRIAFDANTGCSMQDVSSVQKL